MQGNEQPVCPYCLTFGHSHTQDAIPWYRVKGTEVDQSCFKSITGLSPGLRTEYLRKKVHRGDSRHWGPLQISTRQSGNRHTTALPKSGWIGSQDFDLFEFREIR